MNQAPSTVRPAWSLNGFLTQTDMINHYIRVLQLADSSCSSTSWLHDQHAILPVLCQAGSCTDMLTFASC